MNKSVTRFMDNKAQISINHLNSVHSTVLLLDKIRGDYNTHEFLS